MGNSQSDTTPKPDNVKISKKEYMEYVRYKNSLKKNKSIPQTKKKVIKQKEPEVYYNDNKKLNEQIDSGVQNYQYFNSNIEYDRSAYRNFGMQSKDDPRFSNDPYKLLEKEISKRNNNFTT